MQFPQYQPGNCRLLVAVSGGVDSVVLVDLLHRSGFSFTIAHCNFQLRGEESNRDELFVKELAKKYAVLLEVKRFDTQQYASVNKCSVQEAARELRYDWFSAIITSWKQQAGIKTPAFILTAHHADDNIETVLMHFFRGTGIHGLSGISPYLASHSLIRPLLSFRKEELIGYAADRQLSFVEDSSNASDKYTRNFFRNSLLPQIKEVFPKVEENILDNIERFRDTVKFYDDAIRIQIGSLLEQKGNEYHVPVAKWKKATPLSLLSWEIISRFGFHSAQVPEIIRLLTAENSGFQASPTHRIIRNRKWMIIAPLAEAGAEHILIEKEQSDAVFPLGKLIIQAAATNAEAINADPKQALLDLSGIRFPLLLRKWKMGDYFYPLGLNKKKKVSRFLIDLKLSATEKEKVWVLESDKKIIWVIGYRIDHRFRITENTKQAIRFKF